jgi:dTDP-4-dehydrorhamnose reductase
MKPVMLITGGSGLLALNWTMAIRNQYAVTLAVHNRAVALAGVETRQIELESPTQIKSALHQIQPDLVVHTAGLTNVEACEANPGLAGHVNVELAAHVANACAEHGTKLVHISTDHLFDGQNSTVSEKEPIAAVNRYGETKAMAEVAVLGACPQALVVRTNFYGWGTSYRHSFSDKIIQSLRQGEPVTLFEDVFYTPILIDCLANAVHRLVEHNANGIFNVVGDERLSKYAFGIKLAEVFGLDSRLINRGWIGQRAELVQRPLDMSLSNEKAVKQLGEKLGSTGDHLQVLFEQERQGRAKELYTL